MGGSDNKNITVMMINALNHLRGEVYEIFVILDPIIKKKFELNAICNRSPHKIKNFIMLRDMSNLMKRVDFAISAEEVLVGELSYLGVPMGLVSVSENQNEGVKAFVDLELAITCTNSKSVSRKLKKAFEDKDWLRNSRKKLKQIVDGKGGDRLIKNGGNNMKEKVKKLLMDILN